MAKSVLKSGLVAILLGFLPVMTSAEIAQAISLPKTMTDGRVCRYLLGSPHMHSGKSRRMASKHEAHMAALRRWSGFTTWEYGREWGNFRYAARRTAKCWLAHRGGWQCEVEGQPCRR